MNVRPDATQSPFRHQASMAAVKFAVAFVVDVALLTWLFTPGGHSLAWGTVLTAAFVAGLIFFGVVNMGWSTSLWVMKLGALQLFLAGGVFISYLRQDWADGALHLFFLLGGISVLLTPRYRSRRAD